MGSKTTTTQRADPWKPAQAGLKQGLNAAQSLYDRGGFQMNPYGGDMVADPTAALTAGQNGILGMVPGMAQQMGQATGAISGMLDPGAYDMQRQRVLDNIMPALNSTFAGSGMTGSSLHQQNLGIGLSKGMSDAEMAFKDQQMRAAGMLPEMQKAQFAPFMAQVGVGTQQQMQNQAEIDAQIQQYMMSQGAEANALKDYMALFSGIGGQFGTQTATEKKTPGFLDYASLGLQAYGMGG